MVVPPTDDPSLPYDVEAEEYLLSCCLLDGSDVIAQSVQAGIGVDSFFSIANRALFQAILSIHEQDLIPDLALVATELKRASAIEDVGGLESVARIAKLIPTTVQAAFFISTVQDRKARRDIIRSAIAATKQASDLSVTIAEIGENLLAKLKTATKPAKPTTFTVWKPSQFLSFAPPADSVILGDSILERGKWTSIVGIGGLGKTRLALWLAVCQLLGNEWCGLKVHAKLLRWIILSTENGLRRWKTDLAAMLGRYSEEQRSLVEAGLLILALTDDEVADLNTGNLDAMRRLTATLVEQKPDVIVFDPFADMIDGDENKTEDVVGSLRVLRQIVRKEAPAAAVAVIHHARTGAGNAAQAGDNFNAGNFGRGAKALYSMVRAEIQLAPGDRENSNLIVMACGKNSDGPKFDARGLVFDPESCSYSIDPDFSLESWRADVNGQRTGKACTIADIVAAVARLAPYQGNEAKTGDIVRDLESGTGAGIRTIKGRLAEATKGGYLRKGSRNGLYRVGSKNVPI